MIIFIILILCKIISGVLGNLWSNSENVKIIALSSRYFCKVSTAVSHLHMIYPAAPRGSVRGNIRPLLSEKVSRIQWYVLFSNTEACQSIQVFQISELVSFTPTDVQIRPSRLVS